MVGKIQEGDRVVYVLPDGPSAGESRPAFAVKVWSDEVANLQVLTDGPNDEKEPIIWATSVHYSPNHEKGTYHWPGV